MCRKEQTHEDAIVRAIQAIDDVWWCEAWSAMYMDIQEVQTVELNELPQHFRDALLALGEMDI
jgi:hypothetical protein